MLIFTVIFLSLMPKPPEIMGFNAGDKVSHLIAYASLMFWFGQLYISTRHHIILAFLFGLLGIVIEVLQGLSGFRFFDYADMLANCTGVLLGWWLTRQWCKGFFEAIEAKFVTQA